MLVCSSYPLEYPVCVCHLITIAVVTMKPSEVKNQIKNVTYSVKANKATNKCLCVCARAYVRVCVRTCEHTYVHICIHMYIRAYVLYIKLCHLFTGYNLIPTDCKDSHKP